MMEMVVGKLTDLLPMLQTSLVQQRDLKDNALRSVSHALNETYLYYRDMEQGKGRSNEVEAQLSRYWSAAAIPIRHFDNELAELCEYKSEYWVNPETWTQDKVEEVGIRLSEVRRKYREHLKPKSIRSKTSKPQS